MKNTFQKAMSIALAIALLFTLAVNAFAEGHIEENVVETAEPTPVKEEAPTAPPVVKEETPTAPPVVKEEAPTAPPVVTEEAPTAAPKQESTPEPTAESTPTSISNSLVVEVTPAPEQEEVAQTQPEDVVEEIVVEEIVVEDVVDETLVPDDVQPEETLETPTPEPEIPVEPEINGSVEIKLHGDGTVGSFQYGDIVILEASVSGYEGVTYSITWECSENLKDWQPAEGNNGDFFYAFTLTEENAYWGWRAVVETL